MIVRACVRIRWRRTLTTFAYINDLFGLVHSPVGAKTTCPLSGVRIDSLVSRINKDHSVTMSHDEPKQIRISPVYRRCRVTFTLPWLPYNCGSTWIHQPSPGIPKQLSTTSCSGSNDKS